MASQLRTETTKRTRIRRNVGVSTQQAVKEAKKLVDKIEESQEEVARITQQIADDKAKLHELMISANLMEVEGAVGRGERFTPASRSTTVIDTQSYFEKVGLDAFIESAKISVTAAKENLSGKELQSISTKIPGKKKPEEVRVKSIADK